MKTLLAGLALSALFLMSGFTPKVAYAASQDECAIWLCLPGGFPDGCGGAHSAMLKRLKKGKSPLPSFSSCAVDSGSSGDASMGKGAWLPERKECVRWAHGHGDEWCTKYETKPAEFKKDQLCIINNGNHYPPGCRSQNYVDIYIDGKKVGETYYW
ncbi:conjugal transfer protein TraL [Serratia marcescens]|uniref:hypothetical protein n=1 Tax=Serratia marcescens TaxID=615 RepID=UPI000760152F|nr:hypothetical protein [Serratia marcescens]MCW6016240.1 conjugal transfer protein TraL [Serratia marcescens]MDP0522316.1 conjugal transfer protein TraL [Serratia marcescens]